MLSATGVMSLLRTKAGFLRDTRAVSAVEFALILPAIVLMLGGAVELSGAITAGNRATAVAETIGQVVSQTQGPIGTEDMLAFIRTAALVDPDIISYAKATGKSLEQAVNVTVSSVAFTLKNPACAQNCQYTASLVFSEAIAGAKRACGNVPLGTTNDVAVLPSAVASGNPIIAVDVEVFYRPIMTTILGSEISFKRSLYFRPRYVTRVNYDKNCPGFPVV